MEIPKAEKQSAPTSMMTGTNIQRKGLIILGVCWLTFGGFLLVQHPISLPPIVIRWETETEFETAGFNIYRAESADGDYKLINTELIPSRAEAATGTDYEFIDDNVSIGVTYYYMLEDVEYSNNRTQHPPLQHQVDLIPAFATHAVTVISLIIGLLLCGFYMIGLKRRV